MKIVCTQHGCVSTVKIKKGQAAPTLCPVCNNPLLTDAEPPSDTDGDDDAEQESEPVN